MPFDIFFGMAYYLSFDRLAYLSNNEYSMDLIIMKNHDKTKLEMCPNYTDAPALGLE